MTLILSLLTFLLSPACIWGGSGNVGDVNITIQGSTSSFITPMQRVKSEEGKYFAADTGIVVIAPTTETPLFFFVNLATNTLNAYLDAVRVGSGPGAVTAFRVYRSAVITSSGTALTINNGNTGSSNTSQMQAYKSPTVSSNGTFVFMLVSGGTGIQYDLKQSRKFVPGRTFLVTATNNIINVANQFAVEWIEE